MDNKHYTDRDAKPKKHVKSKRIDKRAQASRRLQECWHQLECVISRMRKSKVREICRIVSDDIQTAIDELE